MSNHFVAVTTTTGVVHSVPCAIQDAFELSARIDHAVNHGRTAFLETHEGNIHLNVLHLVSWAVMECFE